MADLNAFINKYNGRLVPSCGGYPNQCVSLSQAWASELGVAGCPIFPVGAAKDMLYSRQDAFDNKHPYQCPSEWRHSRME